MPAQRLDSTRTHTGLHSSFVRRHKTRHARRSPPPGVVRGASKSNSARSVARARWHASGVGRRRDSVCALVGFDFLGGRQERQRSRSPGPPLQGSFVVRDDQTWKLCSRTPAKRGQVQAPARLAGGGGLSGAPFYIFFDVNYSFPLFLMLLL